MMKIQLISSPRNISTALMYSFSNRGDTLVVDEPYYSYYLSQTGKDHPGKDEIIASQNPEVEEVFQALLNSNYEKPYVFIKNMAKHFIGLSYDHLEPFRNVILIRNPYQLIASYSQVVDNPEMEDIGAKRQFSIFEELVANNRNPVVLDSGEVLKNPGSVLNQLCVKLNIPFTSNMLTWEKGALKEDGIWAKFWYKNVHSSTGFQKQKTSNRTLNPELNDLYLEAKKYYDILYQHSIKAE